MVLPKEPFRRLGRRAVTGWIVRGMRREWLQAKGPQGIGRQNSEAWNLVSLYSYGCSLDINPKCLPTLPCSPSLGASHATVTVVPIPISIPISIPIPHDRRRSFIVYFPDWVFFINVCAVAACWNFVHSPQSPFSSPSSILPCVHQQFFLSVNILLRLALPHLCNQNINIHKGTKK